MPDKGEIENNNTITEREKSLPQFIQTASLLLDINDFSIKYNDEEIYGISSPSFFKKRTYKDFEMTYKGEEHYTGVDLFLDILDASTKYSLTLDNLNSIFFLDSLNYRRPFLRSIKARGFDVSKDFNHCLPRVINLEVGEGVTHTTTVEERKDTKARGYHTWNLLAPAECYDNILSIFNQPGRQIHKVDDSTHIIKAYHPRWYAHHVKLTQQEV